MNKKLICIVITAFLCLIALSGCGVKYNAVIYSKAEVWIDKDFLSENRVKAY